MARWDHQSKHYGTYRNAVGTPHRAYFQWNEAKQGFVLYIHANGMVALPTAFKSLGEFAKAGYDFKPETAQEMEPTV